MTSAKDILSSLALKYVQKILDMKSIISHPPTINDSYVIYIRIDKVGYCEYIY